MVRNWLEIGLKIQAHQPIGLPCPQYGLAQPGVMDGHRLLLEKTICLSLMVNVIVSALRTVSRVRRICWFLANTRVRVRAYYDGLIRAALAG
jgi:hypothetical protein